MERNGWYRLEERGTGQGQRKPTYLPTHPKKGNFFVGDGPSQPRQPARQPAERSPQPSEQRAGGAGPVCPPLPCCSQTAGAGGPVLLQDGVLHEVLGEFIHARPQGRVVHTKGYGAKGIFENYRSQEELTRLCFLQRPGQKTPVSVRFSLAVSNRSTPDTARNIRGFSVKFYTDQGVFDLLCNHLPVFLVRDAIHFPRAIQAFGPDPASGLADPGRLWRFAAQTPESTHLLTWLYSDAGTVGDFGRMGGHSVNTYRWRNRDGVARFLRYRWVPLAGEAYLCQGEARRLACQDPDWAGRRLWERLDQGRPVEYELRVQLMEEQQAAQLEFDPLDCTKLWPEDRFPPLPVGRLTLEENLRDYWNQTEKLAFSPANLLEGAELSDDRLLQGRSGIYWDAQRARLGADFRSIPINGQAGWCPALLPSSGGGEAVQGEIGRCPLNRGDDFTQAGQRYRSLSPEQQQHLAENLGEALSAAPNQPREQVLGYFARADRELAEKIQSALSSGQPKS